MECNDKNCPTHGSISVRGNFFKVKVLNFKRTKTATVERNIIKKIPKYERYKKIKTKLHVHVPDCIKIKKGDFLLIGEVRKLSKTKNFVVLKKLSGENNESN